MTTASRTRGSTGQNGSSPPARIYSRPQSTYRPMWQPSVPRCRPGPGGYPVRGRQSLYWCGHGGRCRRRVGCDPTTRRCRQLQLKAGIQKRYECEYASPRQVEDPIEARSSVRRIRVLRNL